jgi:hypothetical protein
MLTRFYYTLSSPLSKRMAFNVHSTNAIVVKCDAEDTTYYVYSAPGQRLCSLVATEQSD